MTGWQEQMCEFENMQMCEFIFTFTYFPHFHICLSGRRDSNPLPTAWEAVALPGELLPLDRDRNLRKSALQIKPRVY